jgi:hypothetical protein
VIDDSAGDARLVAALADGAYVKSYAEQQGITTTRSNFT